MTNNERDVKMQNQDGEEIVLSEEEIEEERESSGYYKHVFKKPFEWEGKVYGSLAFDFESLTGRDTLAVERELAAKNIIPVVRSLSLPFQMLIAVRASTEPIGTDMLEALPIKDFEKIMNRVRIFFISAE